MIHVDIHETIERPIEDVLERLVDIDGYRDWMPEGGLFITCSQESEGPVGEGTAYRDVTRLGAVRGDIVAFPEPREVVFHYTFRLFRPLVQRIAEGERQRTVDALKASLEGAWAPPGAA